MKPFFFATVEIVIGVLCLLFNKRFAYAANNYRRKALLKKYDDVIPLRIAYILGGIFLLIVGSSTLLKLIS
jgi:hypothetical protein